jgi:hypothetical protein
MSAEQASGAMIGKRETSDIMKTSGLKAPGEYVRNGT